MEQLNDHLKDETNQYIQFYAKTHKWQLKGSLKRIIAFAIKASANSNKYFDTMTELLYTVLPQFYLLDHDDQRKLLIAASESRALWARIGRQLETN
jgi:hypothetical protein